MEVTKVWWDGEKLMAEPIDPTTIYQEPAQPDSTCSNTLRAQGKAYPRTCVKCKFGPCVADPVGRTWVGLTDYERTLIRKEVGYNQFMTAGEYAELVQKATESILKAKNQ